MSEKKDISGSDNLFTIKNIITFEIRSIIGRLVYRHNLKIKKDNKNYLHLGCGSNVIEGWINADFYPQFKFWKTRQNKPDWYLDIRHALKCDDNIWDGVFSEHVLEHLSPLHVKKILRELIRTMKPGAWLRISVPDLKKYVEFYINPKKFENTGFNKFYDGCSAIHFLTQQHFHLSVWDVYTLTSWLNSAGFVNIRETGFGTGTDKNLIREQKQREWESLYIEAQKPEI